MIYKRVNLKNQDNPNQKRKQKPEFTTQDIEEEKGNVFMTDILSVGTTGVLSKGSSDIK